MNALLRPNVFTAYEPDRRTKLLLRLGEESLESIVTLLRDRGFPIKFAVHEASANQLISLYLSGTLDPLWIAPLSRWLHRRAGLQSLITQIVEDDGKIIAECRIYC